MRTDQRAAHLPRRSFLSRLGAGAAAIGAVFGAAPSAAWAQSTGSPGGLWQPVRHSEDDWFDVVSAKHRVFFDSITADGFGQAIFFANNTFTGNRNGYGLADSDVAIVICARHEATAFAFSNAMWEKYGATLADRAKFTDPKTKQSPTTNVFLTAGYGAALRNNNVLLDAILSRGVRLAVCSMATRGAAGAIAQKTGAAVDDVFKELTGHLVPNAHMVPAGIVAVNRAQERGYSFAYAG